MKPLADAMAYGAPWPHFTSAQAFGDERLRAFDALFDEALAWDQHASTLYDGAMSDMTGAVSSGFRAVLVARMSELLGVELTPDVRVNLQRMAPGQDVRVHSDVPLLGYESARLVLQLNHAWSEADGGQLCLHPDAAGAHLSQQVWPRRGSAVAFVLTPTCFHSVVATARERRSVVFYFWHVGNTAALRDHLRALYSDVSVADLPVCLDAHIAEVDASRSEDEGHRVMLVAWTLAKWGYGDALLTRAYVEGLQDEAAQHVPRAPRGDDDRALLLARWAVQLYAEHFDLTQWTRLAEHARVPLVQGSDIEAFRALAFPSRPNV